MTTRAQILRLLRAGAGDQARAAFRAGGWDGRQDPEARLLKARLGKDDALRASGPERARAFLAAAAEYAAAAEPQRSTYALINAASLALLGGDRALAVTRARAVLAMLESGAHEPDTGYWLAATRAEAQLLLGQPEAMRDSLHAAIAAAPRAWEEHAITLHQFALLLEALGEATTSLDAFRPRPVLHFSGIMGVGPADLVAAGAVAAAVDRIGPSAGFGALAAGADILVAEALQRVTADLHVVLPCAPDEFRAQSVLSIGGDWAPRFDRLLQSAASITVAADAQPARTTVDLADQAAMGLAIGRARTLATGAVALRVTADGEARRTSDGDRLWLAGGFGIDQISVPRAAHVEALAGGAGEPWTALLVSRGVLQPCGNLVEALAAAEQQAGANAQGIGLDVQIAPEPRPGRALAAATAAAEIAAPGSLVATRTAMAVAQLNVPRLQADLIGEVQTAFGVEELWRLRLPR